MAKQLKLNQYVIPLERNVKSKCQICSEQFGVIKRQHICKRCLRSVCDDCSPFKVKSYTTDYKNKAHRKCRSCNVESQVLKKYVKNHHLKFGEDSDVVKMWFKQLGVQKAPRSRIGQKKKVTEMTTFLEVWKSLNFSFREFIGLVIDNAKISEQQLTVLINSALTEVEPNQPSDLQDIIYILLFFLAHSSVINAIYFTSVIMEIVCPASELKLENISYFLVEMECSQIEAYKMENLIEQTSQKILKRATANVFTAEITIQIMNYLIGKRDIQQLEKALAFVFADRREFILMHSNKPEKVYLDILRNLDASSYRKGVKGLMSVNSDKSEKSERNGYEKSISDKSQKSYKSECMANHKSKGPSLKEKQLNRENQELKSIIKSKEEKIKSITRQYQKLKKQKNNLGPNNSQQQGRRNSNEDKHGYWRDSIDANDFKDPYSTEMSGDQQVYNSILTRKNQQIARLKAQLITSKKTVKQFQQMSHMNNADEGLLTSSNGISASTMSMQSNNHQKQLKQKDEEIMQLRSENQGLKNINKRLLMKMHELSNLLMDKQQKSISESNQNLQALVAKYQEMGSEEMKKQCTIF